jgi:hypothetical protein
MFPETNSADVGSEFLFIAIRATSTQREGRNSNPKIRIKGGQEDYEVFINSGVNPSVAVLAIPSPSNPP